MLAKIGIYAGLGVYSFGAWSPLWGPAVGISSPFNFFIPAVILVMEGLVLMVVGLAGLQCSKPLNAITNTKNP